ncbi:hypothetical protein DFH08DRAFT_799774 [Mycena albidolilacea]|uniref:Uncharacterized protein n=1 Tax=Mycena albidolilacea TaxID=1033008 RepID=A0AAD7AMX7_9AGAR|nr:hypothetical protein DFH08DRAFT_799774 [Mycena albidolilacea]
MSSSGGGSSAKMLVARSKLIKAAPAMMEGRRWHCACSVGVGFDQRGVIALEMVAVGRGDGGDVGSKERESRTFWAGYDLWPRGVEHVIVVRRQGHDVAAMQNIWHGVGRYWFLVAVRNMETGQRNGSWAMYCVVLRCLEVVLGHEWESGTGVAGFYQMRMNRNRKFLRNGYLLKATKEYYQVLHWKRRGELSRRQKHAEQVQCRSIGDLRTL